MGSRQYIAVVVALALITLSGEFACNRGIEERRAASSSTSRPADASAPDSQVSLQSTESADSGITREEQSRIPPGPPGVVDVSRRNGDVMIEWNGTRDDTITGYSVYRRCNTRADGAEVWGGWEHIGMVRLRDDDSRNRARYSFQDQHEGDCQYTVAALDADGRAGPKTTETQN